MELTKKHREALLSELTKAKKDFKLQKDCLKDAQEDERTKHLSELFDISIFLAEQRIKLIEQSLIDNEIDF